MSPFFFFSSTPTLISATSNRTICCFSSEVSSSQIGLPPKSGPNYGGWSDPRELKDLPGIVLHYDSCMFVIEKEEINPDASGYEYSINIDAIDTVTGKWDSQNFSLRTSKPEVFISPDNSQLIKSRSQRDALYC